MSTPAQPQRRYARSLLLGLALALAGPAKAGDAAPEAPASGAEDPDSPPPPTSGGSNPGDPARDASDPFADPPPRDPDDAPFLAPPRNQLGQWSAGRQRPTWQGYDDDHWVQLTATPVYAAVHVPFIGRGGGPTRGGGVGLELDLRVTRWLFLRAFGTHTVHPAFNETRYDEDTEDLVQTARAGLIQATNVGASAVYALDIGRYVPRVDVGAGLLFVRTPEAIQDGQWGAECRQGGVCDLGLACDVENICRPAPVPEFHIGIGLDILLGKRWSVGLAVRYYVLLAALDVLPFYLQGSARLSVRF